MNIFYDTEFIEGTQDKRLLGIKYGKTKPTIDLVSIGLVAEDGREYYAISKDFNLNEAWNRWDGEYHEQSTFEKSHGLSTRKKYWIRENVLKTIFNDLHSVFVRETDYKGSVDMKFSMYNLKYLIEKYGKTNKQIGQDLIDFMEPLNRYYSLPNTKDRFYLGNVSWSIPVLNEAEIKKDKLDYHYPPSSPILYGYYSAYDHVALCWLFGKMIDLPKSFPMYTIDLKQILDEKQSRKRKNLKEYVDYPKKIGEHNALQDARWNKKLYEFLQNK